LRSISEVVAAREPTIARLSRRDWTPFRSKRFDFPHSKDRIRRYFWIYSRRALGIPNFWAKRKTVIRIENRPSDSENTYVPDSPLDFSTP